MDNIKEFNFKVNGFDINASYLQKTIDDILIPLLRKWASMNNGKDEGFIIKKIALDF